MSSYSKTFLPRSICPEWAATGISTIVTILAEGAFVMRGDLGYVLRLTALCFAVVLLEPYIKYVQSLLHTNYFTMDLFSHFYSQNFDNMPGLSIQYRFDWRMLHTGHLKTSIEKKKVYLDRLRQTIQQVLKKQCAQQIQTLKAEIKVDEVYLEYIGHKIQWLVFRQYAMKSRTQKRMAKAKRGGPAPVDPGVSTWAWMEIERYAKNYVAAHYNARLDIDRDALDKQELKTDIKQHGAYLDLNHDEIQELVQVKYALKLRARKRTKKSTRVAKKSTRVAKG
ncbi:MAG: hypothetical protein Q9168_007113 [Polycauliona sp. 1 TL-2023]